MEPFLLQVARRYHSISELTGRCFVFPNRRSLVFFRKYLSEEIRGDSKPIEAPLMFTINDLFCRISGARQTDKVRLLLDLYESYQEVSPIKEDLDTFIFWGDILLSDFDDVDKYLVDPERLFANVADFKGMQDTYSYLTDQQRKAIEDFMAHFHKDGRLSVDIGSDNPSVKARFLQIWDILYPLYESFRSKLGKENRPYEGQVYRSIAESLDKTPVTDLLSAAFPEVERYVFVGLNALNECEKKLLRKMRDARIADFCWDYSGPMITDKRNKSSFFMDSNLYEFPQVDRWDADDTTDPEFNVVSVSSATGQAKILPSILEQIGTPSIDTAVVLPDENMLIPVLNAIPEDIKDINVTMGYPMGSSELYSFMTDVSSMQLHLRFKDDTCFFYHKQVHAIFASSIFKSVCDEAMDAKIAAIKQEAKYYIPAADLSGHPVFDILFRPVIKDSKAKNPSAIRAFGEYQQEVIRTIAGALKSDVDMAMELEFAREYYTSVGKLLSYDLPVTPLSWCRLLSQLVGSASVPFKGEPLRGLQIMGPLETRALDFENLIILSCNEGVFPRRSVSSSFIPPELRKGFALPTYEHQDAMWAYYFYRMIRRAKNVWLVYDSRAEGIRSGEESRYIKQLEYHFHKTLKRSVAKSAVTVPPPAETITKTEADLEKLRHTRLSASALQNYLYCPARFYYHTICRLSPESEITESLDAGMIGNVFHKTMCSLYSGRVLVSVKYIDSLLKSPETVRNTVENCIKEELNTIEVTGRNLVFEEVILKYALKALERDAELMRSYGTDSFRVLGLELERKWSFGGYDFVGYIDRLDSFRDGEVRIVDYKTGKVEKDDIEISDANASNVVEKLFGPDNTGRPKIALQLFLYDKFVQESGLAGDAALVNSIYQTSELFLSEIRSFPVSREFCSMMEERLGLLLDEISDLSVPFVRTDDKNICKNCDFKNLCGR